MNNFKRVLCLIMALVFGLVFSSCDANNATSPTDVQTTAKEPASELSFSYFNTLLQSNIVAAREEFENNLYSFTVEVSEIHSSYITGYVIQDMGGYFSGVSIYLSSDDIKDLSIGDEIMVEGYIEIFEAIGGGNGFSIKDAVVVG